MRYTVEVLDSTKTRTAFLTGLTGARLSEKINGRGLLVVETIEPSEGELLIPGTGYLRVKRCEGGTHGTYRVIETKKTRSRERISFRATARHILFDTAVEIFADAVSCVGYTPAELMTTVLGHSAYTPGTVEPSAVIPFVRFEYETILDCLGRICRLTGGELSLDEETGEISLLDGIGADNGVVFRYGINLRGATRRISTSMMANRVYGVGGGDPPLLLDDASESGGKTYAEDVDSIAAFGLCEGVCCKPALEKVLNLIKMPALDGVYTDGLCEHWTKTGAPTVSENTDPGRLLYGTASQHIQSSADGQGIEQTVTVDPGNCYSLMANLFLESGTVRVRVTDGTSVYRREAPVTGTGFVTVRIENWKPNGSSVTVAVTQEGSGTADFFIDSVQMSESPRVQPFTVGSSADTLWDRAVEYLNARKNPEITYEIDLVDLYGDTRAGGEADKFGLGDTITVKDPTLGLDIATRVMEREVDLLRPWRVTVSLDNAARSLADILTAIREEQKRGIRLQRTSFTEHSKTAEEGSKSLGFSNSAFRFFGRITPTSWNSLTWTAGTLRAGIGYYAIAGGGASGLTESTTRHFFFDRTSPTAFGMTASPQEAEGEDRIHVFSVTTTASPDLCVIHPMGIIHD